MRGGSQAEEAGELEHLGAQDSSETKVTAPEAQQGMESAQARHPLPCERGENLGNWLGDCQLGIWRGWGKAVRGEESYRWDGLGRVEI